MMQSPTLVTDRLNLRWLTLDDAALLMAIWNDPAFVRNVGDRGIRTLDQARSATKAGPLTLYEKHGFGPFRVALKSSDEALGICGLFQRDNLDDPDIGFALLPEFCSKGYAGEAAGAVCDYSRKTLGLKRLTAIVSPGNAPSIRLIEKLGMSFESMIRMPGDADDVCLYAVQW